MPTMNIIGYLWTKRQDLDIDGIPDLLHFVADLQQTGLRCVEASDMKIFGVPTGASVQLIQHSEEEWAKLVEDALISASIEHTIHMLHKEGERE